MNGRCNSPQAASRLAAGQLFSIVGRYLYAQDIDFPRHRYVTYTRCGAMFSTPVRAASHQTAACITISGIRASMLRPSAELITNGMLGIGKARYRAVDDYSR